MKPPVFLVISALSKKVENYDNLDPIMVQEWGLGPGIDIGKQLFHIYIFHTSQSIIKI